jgi:hypothetical protein
MSEQNTIAEEQQKAYEALAHDFTDFIKAKVRAGENSYKLVNIYKQYDIDADSFDTVKLDDAKAEKLALICMDLANAILWLHCHRDEFKDTEFIEVVNGNYPKYVDSEGKHPLLISGNLSNYPVNSLKSLLRGLTTTIDQYEQPQHPKAQKDAAHINKHAMHLVRLYYTAFDILEQGRIITRRDKEHEELLAIRNGKYMREDGSYAPEFFESVDQLETRFQRDVKKTELPAKPDFAKIEELLVEINKSYLHRIM